MGLSLNAGTVEILPFNVTDLLGEITSLESFTVDYKVMTEDESSTKVDWAAVEDISGMRVDVLLDTTGWAEGNYKLYIRPNIPPESPILGPFVFGLS